MTKIKEKNTAWIEVLKDFFISEEDLFDENNESKEFKNWKNKNADSINEKSIADLEKMLEHKNKKRRKEATVVEKTESTSDNTRGALKENNTKEKLNDYEQEK